MIEQQSFRLPERFHQDQSEIILIDRQFIPSLDRSKMHYFGIERIKTSYISPNAPLIRAYLFHGVGGSATALYPVEDIFKKIASKAYSLDLHMLSFPGHGRSDDLPHGWGVQEAVPQACGIMAAYIKQVREHELSNEKPFEIAVGVSFGGYMALRIASLTGFDGIICLDSPVYDMDKRKQSIGYAKHLFLKIGIIPEKDSIADITPQWKSLLQNLYQILSPNCHPTVLTFCQTCMQACSGISPNELNFLKEKKIPTLYFHGSNYDVVPRQQPFKFAAEMDGLVRRIEILNGGHSLANEHPELLRQYINDWLLFYLRLQNEEQNKV